MALSNKHHKIVLATGNKSEMAVGYATLYGDMCGGFAPLKDISKSMVYKLSKYRNTISEVIPSRVITRPPSAELAPDQRDDDTLPPYSVLDSILKYHIEEGYGADEIASKGHDRETVVSVLRRLEANEHKRWQMAPAPRVSPRAFGQGWRHPLASRHDWRR